MSDILPKIIGGVVVVAVIGGAAMMVTRHKGSSTGAAPGVAPGMETPASPIPTAPIVQDDRKYKRDMLDYVPEAIVTATKKEEPVPVPVQTGVGVAAPGPIPGVAPDANATASNVPPKPVAQVYAGRVKLEADKIAHQIKLESTQLKAGEKISLYYTCNQKNASPPLNWSNAPSGTKSFVVMLEGPDRGKGEPLQWAVYNIPASETSLAEGMPRVPVSDKGIGQAQSELGPVGYAGPCIPKGEFTFVFSVYALDTELKLHGGATRNELIGAMNGHVIDMAKLPVSHYFRL